MRHLLIPFLCLSAWAGSVSGRVTDGVAGLPGVRIYPDRLHRPWPSPLPPIATTDAEGRFTIPIKDSDTVLVAEKTGWERDLVPLSETVVASVPIILRRAAQHRIEKVLVIRLDYPDAQSSVSDDVLRARLFYHQPNIASAANYLYEASKGGLLLEEGAILHLMDPEHPKPRSEDQRSEIVKWAIAQLEDLDLGDLDRVNNQTGAQKPDGKPDHLWIFAPGPAQTITTDHADLSPISFLEALPWNPRQRWPVLFLPEETPLGNIVHESFHAMGEHRVDDFYLDHEHPDTAGIWDLMDVGMYRGWDSAHGNIGPWFQDTAYSPSLPMGWTRAELWYRGQFKTIFNTLTIKGHTWTGWLDPLERAPRADPQRLIVPDPRGAKRFWELNVRRPWGFDRGRVGNRWGPGHEGLVVARIDPSKLTPDEPQGPVHAIDAHPGTLQPPQPRFPNARWQLDDAAFNLGTGENPRGQDGPLSWEVLAVDEAGRMQVRVTVKHKR